MTESLFDSKEWKEVEAQTLQLLQELIRFKSINYSTVDSGHESEVCEFIRTILLKEGIECSEILESIPGRGNMIARIRATNPDPELKPLALNVHLDVVPAPVEEEAWKKEGWKFDPFAGHINEEDGCLYGRGAVDMKNMVAMAISIMLFLKRKQIPLKRDVILIALADEENDGFYGAKWLVENYPAEVECDVMLGEGGGFNFLAGMMHIGIALGEKGTVNYKLIARGPGGHASLPTLDNPIFTISKVVQQLTNGQLRFRQSPLVEEFFAVTGSLLPFPKNRIFQQITSPTLSNVALAFLPKDKQHIFTPMLHNTAVPTIIQGGVKNNQIPSSCELTVNGRVLPGLTQEEYFSDVRELLGENLFSPVPPADKPKLEIEVVYFGEGHQQITNDPRVQVYFRVIEEMISKHTNNTGRAIPFLLPATTDLRYFIRHPTRVPVCIGFLPTLFPEDINFAQLYHGVNERIPIQTLNWGIRVLYDTILKMCS